MNHLFVSLAMPPNGGICACLHNGIASANVSVQHKAQKGDH